ncbi:MAG: prepilin-type N-terminal cleavage/methylation domain-containing protein [Phycisphaerales bacterium]
MPLGRGFTLLESVLALAILTAVIVVCLQLRAQIGMVGRQVQRSALRDNAAEALFQSLVNGLLGTPQTDRDTGLLVWEGTQNGAFYRVTRASVSRPNPLAGQVSYDVAAQVSVFRYEVKLGSELTEFLWHR